MGTAGQTVIWILAVCLGLCLTAFAVGTAWFLLQWRKMDRILDSFQRSSPDGERRDMPVDVDIQETRESRIVSQLRRIVTDARFREEQAVGEKDQIMELLSDLSHQLKTPLTSALVLIDNLSENPNMDFLTRQHFMSEITNQVTGMSWLITAMMKLSRLEAGVVELQGEQFGMKEFVEEVLGRLEMEAELKQLTFFVEIPEGAVFYADRKWTAEALLNLVKNAIEHSPSGSTVKILVEENEVYTQIAVHDYGNGVTEEERRKLFQRFYNGNSAREDSMGIGLALAKEIIELQNGTLRARNRPVSWSMFFQSPTFSDARHSPRAHPSLWVLPWMSFSSTCRNKWKSSSLSWAIPAVRISICSMVSGRSWSGNGTPQFSAW